MQTISFIQVDCCSFPFNVPSIPDPNDKDGSNRAGEFPTKTALEDGGCLTEPLRKTGIHSSSKASFNPSKGRTSTSQVRQDIQFALFQPTQSPSCMYMYASSHYEPVTIFQGPIFEYEHAAILRTPSQNQAVSVSHSPHSASNLFCTAPRASCVPCSF